MKYNLITKYLMKKNVILSESSTFFYHIFNKMYAIITKERVILCFIVKHVKI